MAEQNTAEQAKMVEEYVRLKKENEDLKAKLVAKAPKVTLKVSEKGGVSAYGLGRFPVTLYRDQWLRLLDQNDAIRAFLAANADKLSTKGDQT